MWKNCSIDFLILFTFDKSNATFQFRISTRIKYWVLLKFVEKQLLLAKKLEKMCLISQKLFDIIYWITLYIAHNIWVVTSISMSEVLLLGITFQLTFQSVIFIIQNSFHQYWLYLTKITYTSCIFILHIFLLLHKKLQFTHIIISHTYN